MLWVFLNGLHVAFAQTLPAQQLPTGGVVSAGQATITQSGNTLNITQTSPKAVVDWSSFNIGAQGQVNFQQPNAQSATLNRVSDTNPSQILGRITAPGQVVLVNPQGVYFGKTSSVDVGALVATTHKAAMSDFMMGKLKFERQGSTGSVVNDGQIRAALGGYIALLAPEVQNNGVIVANLGTVAMASGETVELQFNTGGALTGLRVSASTINALVENKRAVQAPGGLIILSAQAMSKIQSGVVKNSGTLEAVGLASRGGRIVLEASTTVANSGTISVNAGAAQAGLEGGPSGMVSLSAPEVIQTGVIAANNALPFSGTVVQTGGQIDIQATTFTQSGAATLDVSSVVGAAGSVRIVASDSINLSGQVLAYGLGGLGGGIQLQATRLVDLQTAVLDASGADGGGRIHLQSDGVPGQPGSPDLPMPGRVALGNNTLLRVSSSRGQAGRVEVEGDDIRLDGGTSVDATGATKGGTVWIGGGWQGSGPMRQATTVVMRSDSWIDASATDSGDGGEVVLWSAVANAQSATWVEGTINAKAGMNSGNGGRVETSGHFLQINGLVVNASSAKGQGGEWLLDPYNIIISTSGDNNVSNSSNAYISGNTPSNINVSTITNVLNSGTSVTVQTGSGGTEIGDLQVNTPISKTAGGDATLTLKAINNVVVSGAITSSSYKLHINLIADTDQNGAGVIIINSNLNSNGGNIAFGTGSTINFGGVTTQVGGDVYITGNSGVTWATAGGTLSVYGQTLIGNPSGLTVNTAGGAVLFNSSIDSANSYQGVTATYDWTGALAAAASGTGANTGDTYLATITTRLENAIASQAVNYQSAWLGARRVTGIGSDTAWRWVSGPEGLQNGGKGLVFFYQTLNGSGGSTVSGYFSNWNAGEPNNCCSGGASSTESESVMQFTGALGQWNDLPKTATTLSYYVKETNASPSPLIINAGSGAVSINGAVGVSKPLSNLTVTAGSAVVVNGGGLVTTGAQTVNQALAISSNTGTLQLGGALTASGNVTLSGDALLVNSGTSISTSGVGALTIQPTSTSFSSALSWPIGNLSVASDITGLTLGKNGNTADLSIATNTSIAGPISLFGGAINMNANLATTNATTGDLSITGVAGLTGSGNIGLANNRALTVSQSGSSVYNGIFSGTGVTFTKSGSGSLVLTATETYTGSTTISAGTLQLGNGGTSGAIGSADINDSGVLAFNRSDAISFSNLISGTGGLTKLGSNTLTLLGPNTYSGGTTVSGGTLAAGVSSAGAMTNGAFGTGLVTVQSGYTLDLNGFSLGNSLNLSGAGIGSMGALINSSLTPAADSGAITISSATSLGGSGSMTLSGAISASTNAVSFVNGANVTATNTSNSIATVSLTNSASVLKTTAALTVNASSLSGTTTLQTVSADKDITVAGAITNNTNGNTLTLMASRDIIVSSNISGATGKSLHTYFYANTDNNGAGGYSQTSVVSTYGGNVVIRGGTADTTLGCSAAYSCIAGYANGNTGNVGISLTSTASINAAGGNIAMYGMGNSVASSTGDGIRVMGNAGATSLSTTNTGTITLDGKATGAWNAVRIGEAGLVAGSGLISLTGTSLYASSYDGVRLEGATSITTSGALNIAGTGGSSHFGVWMFGTGNISAVGDITINGQNASGNFGVWLESAYSIKTTTGNIALTGSGTGGVYSYANLLAGNTTTPTSGGGITVNATSSSSNYGLEVTTSSLIAYGPIALTASSAGSHGIIVHGSGGKVQSASGITINGTGSWGLTLYDNAYIQSTGGNIAITANGTSGGLYVDSTVGNILASNMTVSPTTATPTAGGSLTINASATSGGQGALIYSGSLISYGAMSLTTRGLGNAQGLYIAGTGAFKSVGPLTIDSSTTGASWGVELQSARILQSTAGNVSVTGVGNYGVYMNGSIVASNDTTNPTTATPSSGGTLTLNATGRTVYGLQLAAGSLVSNGALSVTGSGYQEALYIYGAGGIKSNGNISLNGTATHPSSYWGIYLDSSRTIQSMGGNITLTASGAGGVYMNGGSMVAGNDLITPTSGGSITINSSARGPDIAAAGLRIDGYATKIISYGDIAIYANAAPSGLNAAGAGHGVILYGGGQTIRSYGGKLTITGYANQAVGSYNNWANISGGITLWDGSDVLQSKGDLTLKGVSMQGIGIYLTVVSAAGGGVTSDNGNITINGLNNSGYGSTYLRMPITATNGSVYISGAGNSYYGTGGIAQDSGYGSVSAKYDINMIGYSTAMNGVYLNVGSVTSTNGSIYLSGYTSSTNGGYYGIYSNAINASAVNGSIAFQGAKINSAATGSGYLVNAAGTLDVSNNPAPIFAVADSANIAYAATNGLYWTGNVTANTSNGYIQLAAKTPIVTGSMSSYGLALLGNNQNYSLTGANSVSSLAASIGTGSLVYTSAGALNVGSFNSIVGITAGSLTLTAGGLTDTGLSGITVTNASTIAINNATGSYAYGGVIAGPVTLTKSGAGIQTLSATSSYTGGTSVTGGTLVSGANTASGPPISGPFGSGTITINGGTLDLYGKTVANPLSMAGTGYGGNGAIINSSATAGQVTGTILLTAASTIGGPNPYVITNTISGPYGLTKLSANTVTFSGVSTYSGATTVAAGTLKITGKIYCTTLACNLDQNPAAVITVRNGAVLEINDWSFWGTLGSNYYDNYNIIMDGGTLRYAGTTSTSSGRAYTVTSNGATFENASSGTTMGFDYSPAVTYNPIFNGNVKFTGPGNIAMSQIISGAINLTKEGTGTLTLYKANTYTGITTINGGVLKLASTGSLYSSADITTNLYVNAGAVLDLYNWGWYGSLGGFRFDPPNLVINGGTVRYSGLTGGDWRSFTVGSSGATFDNPTAGVTWSMNNSAQPPVISGNITFTGAGNTVMNHTLTGSNYSVIMNGTGTVTLGGTNTYTGNTLVNTGILSVSSSGGLGSTSGTTTVASGASLQFTNNITVPESVSVTGSGYAGTGALRNLSGSNTLTSLVTVTGDTKIQSDAGSLTLYPPLGNAIAGNFNLTFDGAGTTMTGSLGIGSGAVTKLGGGVLNILTANTYTGGTTISAGTLQLGNGGATGSVVGNIVNNGTLALNYNVDTAVANIISGTGAVQVIGASGTLWSNFLTTTAQTIATNTTVAEVLYRLSGARENGQAVNNGGTYTAGIYAKTFDPLTNTANFQVQAYDGTYTKFVYVKLLQNATNVQIMVDTSNNTGTGAAYKTGNFLGTDMTTGASSMPLALTSNGGGYGVDILYTSAKVNLTGTNSFSGGVTLNNTTTTASSGTPQYSQTSMGTLQVTGTANLGSGGVTNNGLLVFNDSAAQTLSNVVSGSGYLLKSGTNTLTLTGNNTFTGTVLAQTGSLQLGSGGTTGTLALAANIYLPVFTAGTSNFIVNHSDNLTLGSAVKGVGIFEKSGANDLTLTNALNAVFNISNGRLIAQNDVPSVSGSYSGAGTFVIQSSSNSFTSAYSLTGMVLGSSLGGLTVGQTTNTKDVTLSNAITIAGPISVYAGTINVNANLTTSSGGVAGAVLLKASGNINQATGVDVTTNGGSVTYWADSDANNQGSIYLVAGTSGNTTSITTSGGSITMGGGSNLLTGYAYGYGNTFANSHGINIDSYSTLSAGTGAVILRGASVASLDDYIIGLRISGAGVSVTGGNLSLSGNAAGAVSANNKGAWGTAIINGAAVTGSGTIDITGTGGGNTASGSNYGVWIANPVTGTGSGAMTITGIGGGGTGSNNYGINISNSTTVKSNNASLSLVGRAGSGSNSQGINLGGSTLGGAGQSGGVTFSADTLSLSGSNALTTTGTVTFQTFTAGATIGIGTGSGTLSLPATLFSGTSRLVTDGASNIVIGSSTTGAITIGGTTTFTDNVTVQTGSNITLNTGANITNTQTDAYIALAATSNFVNNTTGASAFTTTGSNGRWLVYSAAPGGDTFGTLDSANAPVWNQTYATQLPSAVAVTGNRYIFASIPSVAVTASSVSKTYGDVLTGNSLLGLSNSFTAGVFTFPTFTDVFSAMPTATSAGLVTTASVVGGPYAITVTPGTARAGYNVSYAVPGSITVTTKSLSVTGTAVANKVYDGSTVATLSGGSLVGVINSDTVSLVPGGAFVSKDVANTISVSATNALSGPQASNYNLTQPTGLSANITPKPITMTGLSANDKVYNGYTNATVVGTAALIGSESAGTGANIDGKWYVGDSVSITGPPVGTFNSKNVAEANSVTFSGLTLSGAQAGNYTLTVQSPVSAHITPKTVTLSASKIYDGTTALIGSQVTILGTLGSEVLAFSAAASNDAHVGTLGKYISTIALNDGGANATVGLASNYALPVLNASNAPVTITAKVCGV